MISCLGVMTMTTFSLFFAARLVNIQDLMNLQIRVTCLSTELMGRRCWSLLWNSPALYLYLSLWALEGDRVGISLKDSWIVSEADRKSVV